jgi:hypothetical protein
MQCVCPRVNAAVYYKVTCGGVAPMPTNSRGVTVTSRSSSSCNACVLTSTCPGCVLASTPPSTTRLKGHVRRRSTNAKISRVVDIALRPSSSCNACVPASTCNACVLASTPRSTTRVTCEGVAPMPTISRGVKVTSRPSSSCNACVLASTPRSTTRSRAEA